MMLMPSNNMSGICHYFAGKYPGKIGLLISPDGWRVPPYYLPYALDNGCFTGWNEDGFFQMLRKASLTQAPLWVAVPDVVADAGVTIRNWWKYYKRVAKHGFPLAFVVQDGMEPQDVPTGAYCVFVGGSTEWKLQNAHKFKGAAEWLHIGRVNTLGRLEWAKWCGADSVDGTGWFRARDKKYYDFIEFFEGKKQKELFTV